MFAFVPKASATSGTGQRPRRDRAEGTLRLIALGVAFLMSACTGTHGVARDQRSPQASQGPQSPRIRGWLHTSGRQILDADNRPLRLFSINLSPLSSGQGAPGPEGLALYGCTGWRLPDPLAYQNIEAWGFNSVRLIISWSNLEPTPPSAGVDGQPEHRYNQEYAQAIDQEIKGLTDHGIAVILAMSQAQWSPAFHEIRTPFGIRCQGEGMPAWLYQDHSLAAMPAARFGFFNDQGAIQAGYEAAWRFIAARYASNPMVVGADMVNEPYTHGNFPPQDLHLARLYVRVGAAIREENPNVMLIFQDSNYPNDQPFALRRPPPFSNVVYSFHFYDRDWTPNGLQRTTAYVARAERWNVPLWIGEFDVFDYSSPRPFNPNWIAELRKMLPFLRQNGVSWAIWAYSGGAFLAPGGREPKPGLLAPLQAEF